MTPADYNRAALDRGELSDEHLVELVRAYQRAHGLDADGMAGPRTRAALDQDIIAAPVGHLWVADGVLFGSGVEAIPAHASWYGGPMARQPQAIVAHYTATEPGTARSLHTRRVKRRVPVVQRNTSWHITIAADGAVYQMVQLTRRARHCGSGEIEGRPPNEVAIGIELEGLGDVFPPAQVAAAERVWRALVRAYAIPRELAMLEHSALDPERRSDPGPVWMREHADRVLAGAY